MTLNVPNLDRLISYLEALPPEKFSIQYLERDLPKCGTVACIAGWCNILRNKRYEAGNHAAEWLGVVDWKPLFCPPLYLASPERYPLSRAIRTLKHLRAEFLRTGTVVVDWDAPKAVETQRKAWAPPVVIRADKPLPAELTRLVREPATVTEA